MIYSVESAHAVLKRFIISSQGDLLTTWCQIKLAVSSQIQNNKANAAKDRIRTPLHLNRAQYQACFGYITNAALRLVESNYTSTVRPFKPCTGVFTTTTGLPCIHRIEDIRDTGDSLRPSDFHGHWHWDRYSDLQEPTLDPLRIVSYSASTLGRTLSTKRIPSGFEASEERQCSQCHQPGHTRASIRCIVNIRRQNQELAAESAIASTFFIPRLKVQEIVNSVSGQSVLKPLLQSILDSGDELILKSTIKSILDTPPVPPTDTRPIWPGRPELLYKQYLIEKEAWLTAHPDIQPANYRTARGLEVYSERWCRRNCRYLPKDRLDLQTETLLDQEPNWTIEEISAWLDNDALKDQEVEQQVETELITAGGFGQSRERGVSRVVRGFGTDYEAQIEQYRFVQ
jgi:hypothetical protein